MTTCINCYSDEFVEEKERFDYENDIYVIECFCRKCHANFDIFTSWEDEILD